MRLYAVPAMKCILVACLAAAALGALGVSGAAADGWHVSGVELTGTETAALATTAATDAAPVLDVPALPLKIGCKGPLTGVSPKITAPNSGAATSLTFTECAVIEPTTCTLSSPEIKTEAVTATASLASGTADHLLFKATTAKHFAEFVLEGSSCSISGKKAVTGTVVLNAGTGQTENTLQELEGLGSLEQGTHSLQTANDPSYIEGGRVLLKLESGRQWSFRGAGLAEGEEELEEGKKDVRLGGNIAFGGVKKLTEVIRPLRIVAGATKIKILTITAITLLPVGGNVFTIVNDLCSGKLLEPGAACTFGVKFAPIAVENYLGDLTVPIDEDPLGGRTETKIYTLTGNGTA